MRKTTKMLAGVAAAAAAGLMLTGCTAEADTVSDNLSKEADSFQVLRRVVFFNGITDTYLLEIQGFCSIVDEGTQLEVTCKVGEDAYTKDFLGLSDNVTYFAEQLDPKGVDPYHHIVIFAPEKIIPDIDLQTSGN